MDFCLTGNYDIDNGDCLSVPLETCDFILTDPPYGLNQMDGAWSASAIKDSTAKAGRVGGLPVGMKFNPAQGVALQRFIESISKRLFDCLKPGGFMVMFAQPRLHHRTAIAVENAGFEIRDMLIWKHEGGQGKAFKQDHFVNQMLLLDEEKAALIASMDGRKTPQLRPVFETMVLAQKPREGTFIENWQRYQVGLIKTDFEKSQTTMLECQKSREGFDHPTVKPTRLLERLIEIFTIKGQTVLDPFMGTGSTGVAAISLGRKFAGVEIETTYFNVAMARLNRAKPYAIG